ncbi:MAG TPA: DinB family protein [Puia sp.]|nr:DinB family protein [Puia sp.]
MKDLFNQYAAYNAWATKKLLDAVNELSEEQQHAEITSSFNSLYKTFFHLWSAETIWWQRLQPQNSRIEGDPFQHSMKSLSEGLHDRDMEFLHWVNSQDENSFIQKIEYRNSRGEKFNEPLFQVLLHLFNHGTYHRGQIVTILRQLGLQKIPQTDFIAWVRIKH